MDKMETNIKVGDFVRLTDPISNGESNSMEFTTGDYCLSGDRVCTIIQKNGNYVTAKDEENQEWCSVTVLPLTIDRLLVNKFTIVERKRDGRIVLCKGNNENEQTAYVIIVEFLDGDCHFKIESPIAELNLRFQHYFHELQHALRLVGLGDIEKQLKP